MAIVITGSSGFIGYHLTKKLLKSGIKVIGIDNLNSYYDVELKKSFISSLESIFLANFKPYLLNKNSILLFSTKSIPIPLITVVYYTNDFFNCII